MIACQRFCGAAGIDETLAAGMRLSRSFARPAMRRARKPGPMGGSPAAHVFGIAFARIMSGRAEAPGCDSHPGAPLLACGVSIASPGHFTRRLPPGGSWVLTSHFRLSSRGTDAAQQELRPPRTASCQKAKAIGRKPAGKKPGSTLPTPCKSADMNSLRRSGGVSNTTPTVRHRDGTSHFSLLTSHFSLLTSHALNLALALALTLTLG
jgi:hypothetical protein